MELPHTAWKQINKMQKHKGNDFQTTAPTKEQLQRILSNATSLEKAYFLTLLTTGKRPDEILKIDLKDLHLNEKPPRITITTRSNRTKRRTPYAFITEEDAKTQYKPTSHNEIDTSTELTNSNLLSKTKTLQQIGKKLYPIVDRTIRARWNILL